MEGAQKSLLIFYEVKYKREREGGTKGEKEERKRERDFTDRSLYGEWEDPAFHRLKVD